MYILVLEFLPTNDSGGDGPLGGVDGFSRVGCELLVVGSGRSMGVAQGEERSGTVAHSRYVLFILCNHMDFSFSDLQRSRIDWG